MAIPYNLESVLRYVFSLPMNTGHSMYLHSIANFYTLDLSKSELIIPVFLCKRTDVLIEKDYKKIISCIYIENDIIEYKTAYLALSRNISSMNIQKVSVYNKIYFIGNGMILDSDKNYIMMCANMYQKDTDKEHAYKYIKSIIYLNPKIFTDTDDKLYKYIVKNIIPYYLNNDLSVYSMSNLYVSDINYNVEIVITPNINITHSDLKNTVTPNEDINNFLINNVDNITDLI